MRKASDQDSKARIERKAAERRGRRAEWLAAMMLRLKGYRILDARFKTPVGEIDLIAQKGKCAVFLEVKARRTLRDALESITNAQQRRIQRAALYWMQHRGARLSLLSMRFDVIAVARWRVPYHIKGAWRSA